jgi:hypothetical protein
MKTPYELRFELLSMAQSILSEKAMNERIRIENDWNMQCEKARAIAEITHTAPGFPEFPNVPVVRESDIISVAKKLNEFVSNTGE